MASGSTIQQTMGAQATWAYTAAANVATYAAIWSEWKEVAASAGATGQISMFRITRNAGLDTYAASVGLAGVEFKYQAIPKDFY